MFAIIDIETTGGRASHDRITEIAVVLHDGEKITHTFQTLINPECLVPSYITQITGITNEMLADAPKFYEVARSIIELTDQKIFVAHNVKFDYSFIKNEYKRLGYSYQRKTLCTVRLSRKYFPALSSYSLGRICDQLNITIKQRHRARGDAEATAHLFTLIRQKNEQQFLKEESNKFTVPPMLSREEIEHLPDETGVYYFLDQNGEILYIGKSIHIRQRVKSHFSIANPNDKAINMANQVASIRYKLTGSELLALILESDEIKKYLPKYNRAQRRKHYPFGIYQSTDENGYQVLQIKKTNTMQEEPVYIGDSQQSLKKKLYQWTKDYDLCLRLLGLYATKGTCFHYQIGQCKGACILEESAISYNQRVKNALQSINDLDEKNLLLIDKGRSEGEWSVIHIDNGQFIGYQYAKSDHDQISELSTSFIKLSFTKDIGRIIYRYMQEHEYEKTKEGTHDKIWFKED